MGAAETFAVLMVLAVCVLLFAGYPVALTLGGVSLAFAVIGQIAGVMNFALLGALPQRIYGVMTNDVLLAIPLFIFMGVMLERKSPRSSWRPWPACSVRCRAASASRC
jgi:TRAP-type mannitol/chloroaromatic compound transport system permease large subunit